MKALTLQHDHVNSNYFMDMGPRKTRSPNWPNTVSYKIGCDLINLNDRDSTDKNSGLSGLGRTGSRTDRSQAYYDVFDQAPKLDPALV